MNSHLHREIDRLKRELLTLCAIVEEQVFRAVQAVSERDEVLAERVINRDKDIDRMEVEIEEDCLKILALYQPVAIDLRYIVAMLKINNDLERIGDIAENIAARSQGLAGYPTVVVPPTLHQMTERTKALLGKSLEALIQMNPNLAREVCQGDNDVDEMHRTMYRYVEEAVKAKPELASGIIMLLSVSRGLERIADHAANIAEDVIYMIEGRIVRHGQDQF